MRHPGPIAYVYAGHIAMLFPCAILAGLAAFDLSIGLSAHSFASEPALPNPK